MKTCNDCSTSKPTTEFNKNKRKSDGLQSFCRPCTKIRNNQSYRTSPKRRAKIAERNKANVAFLRRLDSDDPIGLYFDLDNVGFSHLRCNIKDAKNGPKIKHGCGTPQAYDRGCRCEPCIEAKSNYRTARYCPEQRSERYKATGH